MSSNEGPCRIKEATGERASNSYRWRKAGQSIALTYRLAVEMPVPALLACWICFIKMATRFFHESLDGLPVNLSTKIS